jgi:hypothetical protein
MTIAAGREKGTQNERGMDMEQNPPLLPLDANLNRTQGKRGVLTVTLSKL